MSREYRSLIEGSMVWFQDLSSERSSSGGKSFSSEHGLIGSISDRLHRGFEQGSQRIKTIGQSFHFRGSQNSLKPSSESEKKVLDPQGKFLQTWNKIFVATCVLAVSVDPLFLYIPVISKDANCLDLDNKLQTTACVLRFFTDIFYVVHIFFQFRTGFIAPSSRVFGKGILVEDSFAIAKRYLAPYFIIDVLAVLPIPQVVILLIIPKLSGAVPLNTKNLLRFVILFQYIPRVIRIVPLYKEVIKASGLITETAWAGAAFNLFLYMLASHILGAFWYLLAIERLDACWRKECAPKGCLSSIYCGTEQPTQNTSFLNAMCPMSLESTGGFDFGIYSPALSSAIVKSRDFPQKIFYCFWWGLRNLSSLGQNLATSTYVWEIAFAVLIAIMGLVLFALLIGNMQTYLQSTTVRLEEMRVKRRDAEQWMSHRMLPESLRERIRTYEQYKWLENRGVEEDVLIRNLPKDLRRDIKRHLCLGLLKRVPMFGTMDDQLLDALCDCLKPSLFTKGSYIIREGDPVDEMVFIMRGRLETVTTNGGRTGFFNSDFLKEGDFCGEELLTWALDPNSSSNLPSSTRTVKALSEVEAFALMADDLKFVATQFRRLHSKQLRHTFRFYSPQWRTWAACFVQAAWRRHCRKKIEESLHKEEDRLMRAAMARDGSTMSPSLGAAVYVSRFAAIALRNARLGRRRVPDRTPLVRLQKPAEPDFGSDADS
ncbi:hypothetical protein AMTR_s00053p00015490 [Amborella trichopoda]|uniref:Cyclic nucleotide-binding domain-containing protein n=1 Tax=Amborella trichopoda TaxID=13333 RepID=W1PD70_AMBTC|nr:hypothetical protein AMTR_s00053p00015490 [Amborella trichopoda]